MTPATPAPSPAAEAREEIAAAWGLLAVGDSDGAARICHRLIATQGELPALFALAATIAARAGQPAAVAILHERAAVAAMKLGLQHGAAGAHAPALAAHRWAIALCPGQFFHHQHAGETLLRQDRHYEASVAFRRATLLDPGNWPALCRLVDTLVLVGLWSEVVDPIRRAVQTAPDQWSAYFQDVLAAVMFGRPADALRSLERAERLSPGRPAFTFQRGVALRELGDLEGALAAFRAAARTMTGSDRVDALFNAALCVAALGRHPDGLPENSRYAEAELAAGRAAEAAGHRHAAAGSYAAAVAARPDLAEAAGAQRRLLAEWREALRSSDRPITERNPDWVIGEAYRADLEYRALLPDNLVHLGIPGRTPARPAGTRRRVWDAFMISGELDLLELRMKELDGVVDRFVIVESPWTHQGGRKELIFEANRGRFAALADRIVHVVADERREGPPWEQESYQRGCIMAGLEGAADDDLLIVSDVDEIPRREVIARIAADDRLAARINGLSMGSYNYFINFTTGQPVIRPLTMPCGLARRLGPNLARHLLVRTSRHIVSVIPDAGWHFSWLGGADDVWHKLQTFCHLELLDTMPSREQVAAKLAAGDFRITNQPLHGRFVPIDASFPQAVREDVERLRRLGWIWPPAPETGPPALPKAPPPAAREPAPRSVAVTVVRPKGAADVFRELAETLGHGLHALGLNVEIGYYSHPPTKPAILLGAHMLTPEEMQALPDSAVIYNLEQIGDGGPGLPDAYLALMRRRRTWDYSRRNVDRLAERAIAARHVPVGYMPALTRIQPAAVQDIDVLFYGWVNERRRRVLHELEERGLRVVALGWCFGSERDAVIARSKVVLNMHFYDSAVFEIVRVSYLLANRKAVVSECGPNTVMEPDLLDAVMPVPYERLAVACHALVADLAARRALEERGFARMATRDAASVLRTVLPDLGGGG